MKIYTKTGDKGTTSLFDNKRVLKDHIRVESYGAVDELVSFLGLAKNYMNDKDIYDLIEEIQNKLFTVASNLATEDRDKVKYKIREDDIKYLEDNIDKYMNRIKDPRGFIVPGSGKESGYLHVSRTMARRTERRIISLSSQDDIDPLLLKYVNRLSDLLYAIARYLEEDEVEVEYNDK